MSDKLTQVWKVDSAHPEPEIIARAAEIIRSGGLVAFPTETVYGLGADGLNSAAVAGIYTAKGRPSRNPIILHVASIQDALPLVKTWTPTARLLAEHFWPGPLTIVLPRSEQVPDIVTAGGPTVAIRCPTHLVAQALIRAAGVPIAAPSANRSSELSPTNPEHVMRGLVGRIDAILDGGPTTAGIESTVIDLSGALPRLLRPGPIPPGAIEALIGPLNRQAKCVEDEPLASPGMLDRHYAPQTPLECKTDLMLVSNRFIQLMQQDKQVGLLAFGIPTIVDDRMVVISMPREPANYAAELYRVLHDLDERELDCILVQLPPETDEWLAVRDRLLRASTPG